MGLADTIQDGLTSTIGETVEFVTEHPVGVALGTAGVVAGGVVLATALSGKSKKVKRRKGRAVRKRSHRSKDWRYISKQKHERAYQKRRKKLGKKTYGKYYKKKKTRRVHSKSRGKWVSFTTKQGKKVKFRTK